MKYFAAILILGLCGGCLSDSATDRLFPGKEQHPVKPPYIEGPEPGDPDYMQDKVPPSPLPYLGSTEVRDETSVSRSMTSAATLPTPDPVTVGWTLSIPIEVVTSTDLSMWTVESNVVWEGTHATVLNPMTEGQRYWAVRLNGQIIRIDE